MAEKEAAGRPFGLGRRLHAFRSASCLAATDLHGRPMTTTQLNVLSELKRGFVTTVVLRSRLKYQKPSTVTSLTNQRVLASNQGLTPPIASS